MADILNSALTGDADFAGTIFGGKNQEAVEAPSETPAPEVQEQEQQPAAETPQEETPKEEKKAPVKAEPKTEKKPKATKEEAVKAVEKATEEVKTETKAETKTEDSSEDDLPLNPHFSDKPVSDKPEGDESEKGISSWKEIKKFKAEVSEGKIKNRKIFLAKPLTFMNLSGQAVKSILSFYKIRPKNLLVIHDDVDIPLGKIKIIKNRGGAGHKGVQSIISEINTESFVRIRIGIRPKNLKPKDTERFVLLKFNREEKKIVKGALKKVVQVIESIVTEGADKTMNKFNKK